MLEDRAVDFEILLEALFKFFIGVVLCLLAFVFADIAPGGFDVWNRTFVDGVNMR